MPRVTYLHPNGESEELDVAVGMSLMQGATSHGVDGILAECGGNAMCATCHVYVDPDRLDTLPPMSADEDALLNGTANERRSNSRLSCQLAVTQDFDGLIVSLPERQVCCLFGVSGSSGQAKPVFKRRLLSVKTALMGRSR